MQIQVVGKKPVYKELKDVPLGYFISWGECETWFLKGLSANGDVYLRFDKNLTPTIFTEREVLARLPANLSRLAVATGDIRLTEIQ